MDRLSGLDLAFLCLDSKTTPMQMGAVAIFDGEPAADLPAVLGARARRIPKLRRYPRATLLPPGGAEWTDDEDFEPSRHVQMHRITALSTLYNEDPLAEHAARWLAEPLDTTAPLWALQIVSGLPGGGFALLLKLHHALTDGAGAFAVAAGLLDDSPVTRAATAGAEPPPRPRTVRDQISAAVTGAGIASSVVRAVRPSASAPMSAPASPERRLAFARIDTTDLRRIRTAHGGTANDVVLAILAGALRDWLVNRGHRADAGPVRALVPVSVRGRGGSGAGNQLSGYLCDLPVHLDDPVTRLHVVRRAMDRHKAAGPSGGAGAVPKLAETLPPAVHRLATGVAGRAAGLLFDTVVTNVPLPSASLSLGGAPLREVYPVVPLAARQAVGIAAASCHGFVHFGLLANAAAVDDLGSLRDAVLKSTAALLGRS